MKQELRQERRRNSGSEICGTISSIRDVEDCIRATKKYTKGVFHRAVHHPIQGEDFPSKVLTEFYEVFPYVDLSLDMPASTAWAWVWGDEPHIDVHFYYDYRSGKASMTIGGVMLPPKYMRNGSRKLDSAKEELEKAIPGFRVAVNAVDATPYKLGNDA